MKTKRRPAILKSRQLAESWRIKFYEDILQIDAAKRAPFPRIKVPNFAMAVAVRDQDGKIPLVRQYRHGAQRVFWELPGGMVDNNERPSDAVKREFREEVGFKLLEPRFIANIYIAPAYSSQVAHVYTGRVRGLQSKSLDTKEISVRFVTNTLALKLLSNSISASHLLAYLIASIRQRKGYQEQSQKLQSARSFKDQ